MFLPDRPTLPTSAPPQPSAVKNASWSAVNPAAQNALKQ
jgi:hypothetical protein